MCEILDKGIIGVIIGVILGWFLNLLNNVGKVSLYFDNIIAQYYEPGDGGIFKETELNKDSNYGLLSFTLDITNTSNKNRMFRKINLILKMDDNNISKELNDLETRRIVAYSPHYDNFEILNILPKSITKKKLQVYLSKDDFKFLINSKIEVYFSAIKLWGLKRKMNRKITTLINGNINI